MKADFNLKNKSGIYMILNHVNDKFYIGRTKCFYKRCHQYLYDFKTRKIGHQIERRKVGKCLRS